MSKFASFCTYKWALYLPRQPEACPPLTHVDAIRAETALRSDACGYAFNALVSVADAVRGINMRFYTWSAIKLYYAVFYTARASLGSNNFGAFYVSRKPFIIEVRAGSSPHRKKEGSTHKLILKSFRDEHPNCELLTQEIGFEHPLDWFVDRREEMNYRRTPFVEPECPNVFRQILASGVRRSVSSYLAADGLDFAFDPDHAVLAFPLRMISWLRQRDAELFAFSEEQKAYMRASLADERGSLPTLLGLMG